MFKKIKEKFRKAWRWLVALIIGGSAVALTFNGAVPVGLPLVNDKVLSGDLNSDLNAEMESVLQDIQEVQNAYFIEHGQYWQGLASHSVVPSDGKSVDVDLLKKPHDQVEGWADVGITQGRLPFSVKVDVYDGPRGKGYIVLFEIKKGKELYQKRVDLGPEGRSHDWKIYE